MAQEGWGSYIVLGDAWRCRGVSVSGVIPASHPCRELPSAHCQWVFSLLLCLQLPQRTRRTRRVRSAAYRILHSRGASHDPPSLGSGTTGCPITCPHTHSLRTQGY